jgi:cardiolipin synthase
LHGKRRTWVLADQAEGARHHRIRRVYISAIRRARTSIDICAAYFLPGPLFLQALLAASHRGVRVRVLVPAHGDVRVVQLAMIGVLDHLLREGVDVFAYQPAILHSKTSIVDEQLAILGSHNLDELSLRFNLESNLVVDDRAFAAVVARSFERDLEQSKKLDLRSFSDRSASSRLLASVAARLRAFL